MMNETELFILFCLFWLGGGYDMLIGWMQRQGFGDFTAVQVVIGVLIVELARTLAGKPLLLTLKDLAFYAAFGFFLALGSYRRSRGFLPR